MPRCPDASALDIAVLAADRARFGDSRAKFTGVVEQSPERGADVHAGELAAGVLIRPRHAGEPAIFFRESRVEHAAEIDVAGRAAGRDDDRFARADVANGAFLIHRNAEHATAPRRFAM